MRVIKIQKVNEYLQEDISRRFTEQNKEMIQNQDRQYAGADRQEARVLFWLLW